MFLDGIEAGAYNYHFSLCHFFVSLRWNSLNGSTFPLYYVARYKKRGGFAMIIASVAGNKFIGGKFIDDKVITNIGIMLIFMQF